MAPSGVKDGGEAVVGVGARARPHGAAVGEGDGAQVEAGNNAKVVAAIAQGPVEVGEECVAGSDGDAADEDDLESGES
jgi:hypothetical protein